MRCRIFAFPARVASLIPVFAAVALSYAVHLPLAQAQVTYNGTQSTIVTGITQGGQVGYGVAVDPSGNVFVSGMGQSSSYVLEFPKSNGYQYNGVFLNTDFEGPLYGSSAFSIASDNSGLIYVPAPQNQYVAVWSPSSPDVGAVAFGTYPFGVAYGQDGNLYVADNINDDIYEVALNGGNSGVIINPPCSPESVAADRAGNVYVSCGSRLYEFTNEGGGNYSQSLVTSSLSSSGYLQVGVTVDRNGIIYICDSHNNRVLREAPKPGGGFSESSLLWSYNDPSGINVDKEGNLYVSDTLNGKVDEITFPTAEFGGQALGTTSSSQTFSFNVGSGTKIGKIVSLTGGQPTQDFPFTTTCPLGTYASTMNCTLTVSFSPTAVGTRNGAIVFYDNNGNPLYSHAASGVGQAPQVVFNGSFTSTSLVQPAYTSSAGMALDNAGNLFVANQTIDINNYPLYAGSILEYPSTNSSTGGSYGAPVTVASNLNNPVALTVQPNGDLIVLCDNPSQDFTDQSIIYDVPKTQSGFGAPVQIASSNSQAVAAAVTDSASNVYYLAYGLNDNATIYEIPFDGYMYLPPVAVASGFTSLGGLTIDASGNLYAASLQFGSNYQVSGSILEFTAASGFKTSSTVASGLPYPQFLAMEPGGNLIVGNQTPYSGSAGSIQLLPAGESGFGAPITLVPGLDLPNGLAVDHLGNLFATSGYFTGTGADVLATRVFHRTQAPLVFSGTPEGSASSPQAATIENFGNQPLNFSQVSFPANFLEASAETTDCSSSTALAAGATCTLTFTFAPDVALTGTQTAISVNGTGEVTTNSLNGTNVVNTVSLSGTEVKPLPVLSMTEPSSQPIYGQPVTLTATVAGGVGQASTAPTGQVQFFLGSTSLGTETLTGSGEVSSASITVAAGQLAGGANSVTFHYSGDSVYSGETSAASVITLAQANTTATLVLSPSAVTPSTMVTLTAKVANSSSSIVPSGTVTFNYTGAGAPGGAVLNTVSLNNGVATLRQLLPPGQGIVSASYAGSDNFAASTSAIVGFDVEKLTPSVTLTAPTANVSLGTAISLKAVVTSPSSGYQASGTVSFYGDGLALGSCSLASGFCTLSTSSLVLGSEAIYAVYAGDANFNEAMSSTASFMVLQDTPKIAVTFNSNTATYGRPLSVSATVATTDGTTAPTGYIVFEIDGIAVGSQVPLNGGSAGAALNGIGAGYHHLQAMYTGDANYAQGTSPAVALTVSKVTPTINLSPLTPFSSVSTPTTLVISVSGGGGTPTGTVTLYSSGKEIGTGALSGGTATVTLPLAIGQYNLIASYPGDSNFAAATTPVPLPLTVHQGQVGVSVSASATSVLVGQYVAVKVTLQGYSTVYPPTGNVVLFDNGPTLATLKVISGAAGESVLLPVGNNSIEAIYTGDSNYTGGNSNPVEVSVSQATPTVTVSATPNPDLLGGLVTLKSKVSTTAIGVAPTGTVSFFYAGNPVGTGVVSGGYATLTTTALPVGTGALSAQYAGDVNFQASTSPAISVAVQKAKSPLGLTVSATSVTQGTAITLTATEPPVTVGANAVPPTGSITFYNGSVSLGSAPLSSSGVASLTVSNLPVGSDAIHAFYVGDSNFSAAESASVTVTVTAAQ